MRLLHTADWHVGKVLKGVSRLDEHRQVLAEIVEVARREHVDVVLMAGDVFESPLPSPEAQQLAWTTLLDLRRVAGHVFVVAGNHDPCEAFEAWRQVFAAAGITMVGRVKRPADGGVIEVAVGTERLRLAMLPFVSQRAVVKAADLFDADASQANAQYSDRVRQVIEALTATFAGDAVNVVLAHLTVANGAFGGGERETQSIFDYHVSATVFPPTASYVALGHLHRNQRMPAPCPVWYSGSPLAVDFGEEIARPAVMVIDVTPGQPAVVRAIELTTPRRLCTIEGTLAELTELAADVGDALVRVRVTEPARAGLAEDVRTVLPTAVDIRIVAPAGAHRTKAAPSRVGRSPHELFGAYLAEQNIADQRIETLFAALLDDEIGASR